ncbi:PadR family transcriptional regulator [Cryobacterium sp. MDB2-A-1]|uniref:PadR family transcriptional regulator n=1 Tax=unclassified Cryobacterium TaxID=2649013 RepID=UPI00351577D3
MTPVFAHGSLRLYLLSLLAEQPRHGYELIQALSDRFGGTYIPSAGTIYPRLAKLEEEGLVTKSTDGRKTVYEITDAGRAELLARGGDLDALEDEVTDSVRRLADEVRSGVAAAMTSLRTDLAAAARRARDDAGFGAGGRARGGSSPTTGSAVPGTAAGAEASASASASYPGADGPSDTAGSAGASAGSAAPGGQTPPAGTTSGTSTDRRLESNRALHEADLVLNEFRQQLRADLRKQAVHARVPAATVSDLRARLAEVRAGILDALPR